MKIEDFLLNKFDILVIITYSYMRERIYMQTM